MIEDELHRQVRQLYLDARAFFADIKVRMESSAGPSEAAYLGYKILGSPLSPRPNILVANFQPLGGSDVWQRERAYADRWPSENEIWSHRESTLRYWRLASALNEVFGARLEDSVVTYGFWLRCERARHFRLLDPGIRRDVEAFSTEGVKTLIRLLKPSRIVCVGMRSLESLSSQMTDGVVLPNLSDPAKKLALTATGTICGRPAIKCLHLTDYSHLTAAQRRAIHWHLRQFMRSSRPSPANAGASPGNELPKAH